MPDIDSNLVGRWTFDEGSGVAVDSSGNGHTGTLSGGPPTRQPGMLIGNCLKFNGTSDYVDIPANSIIGNLTSSLTIAALVLPRVLPGDRACIFDVAESPSSALGFSFSFRASGVLNFTSKGVFEYASATGIVTPGVWNHVAAVLDSAFDVTFFTNGVQRDTVAHTVGANANTTQAAFIGGAANDTSTPTRFWFDGSLDELRIFGRALSAADIAALALYTGVFRGSNALFPKPLLRRAG